MKTVFAAAILAFASSAMAMDEVYLKSKVVVRNVEIIDTLAGDGFLHALHGVMVDDELHFDRLIRYKLDDIDAVIRKSVNFTARSTQEIYTDLPDVVLQSRRAEQSAQRVQLQSRSFLVFPGLASVFASALLFIHASDYSEGADVLDQVGLDAGGQRSKATLSYIGAGVCALAGVLQLVMAATPVEPHPLPPK